MFSSMLMLSIVLAITPCTNTTMQINGDVMTDRNVWEDVKWKGHNYKVTEDHITNETTLEDICESCIHNGEVITITIE